MREGCVRGFGDVHLHQMVRESPLKLWRKLWHCQRHNLAWARPAPHVSLVAIVAIVGNGPILVPSQVRLASNSDSPIWQGSFDLALLMVSRGISQGLHAAPLVGAWFRLLVQIANSGTTPAS
jgi:hypothetical protein